MATIGRTFIIFLAEQQQPNLTWIYHSYPLHFLDHTQSYIYHVLTAQYAHIIIICPHHVFASYTHNISIMKDDLQVVRWLSGPTQTRFALSAGSSPQGQFVWEKFTLISKRTRLVKLGKQCPNSVTHIAVLGLVFPASVKNCNLCWYVKLVAKPVSNMLVLKCNVSDKDNGFRNNIAR